MRSLSSYENAQSATSALPFGSFQNESSAGSNDGTPIVAEQMQDLYYALYQILQEAGMQPNGNLEDGANSKQFINALANISSLIYVSTNKYNKNAICWYESNNIISVYKSLVATNSASLSDTTKWQLLYQISSSGVFQNVKLNSPALSGTPTAPTAAAGTANTQIATTAFVKNAFSDFIKITSGTNSNGATIAPPSGFTMANLAAFIPAISTIHYSGDVDGNDSTYCTYSVGASYITLTVRSSEQRAATWANWIAIWIK